MLVTLTVFIIFLSKVFRAIRNYSGDAIFHQVAHIAKSCVEDMTVGPQAPEELLKDALRQIKGFDLTQASNLNWFGMYVY